MFSAGDRIGQFRVVREIGQGGMGCVYEVVADENATRLALKKKGVGATRPNGTLGQPVGRRNLGWRDQGGVERCAQGGDYECRRSFVEWRG